MIKAVNLETNKVILFQTKEDAFIRILNINDIMKKNLCKSGVIKTILAMWDYFNYVLKEHLDYNYFSWEEIEDA